MNKVLVIGSGGREHAIIFKLQQSPLVSKIFALPGNGGISEICECITNVDVSNHDAVIDFCQTNKINLVVVGPEQPLVAGIVDSLKNAQINVFGPSKLAARLEGSKIFTKEICDQYDIPTAKYQSFNNADAAVKYLSEIQMPCVVKADGIAAGKGVIIAQNEVEAKNAIHEILGGKFGSAGNQIVIEEFLDGPEVSFFAICDGKNALFFGTAGDHKKVGENETGPNTGGMGTYSPSPLISDSMKIEIMNQIIDPTMKAMADLGSPFSGFLFAGLILTKDGAKLLEFNTRLGDPETQVILPRLKSDLFELMKKSADGNLTDSKVEFSDQSAVCVVMAANGYPDEYEKGFEIKNLTTTNSDVIIFHAGTKKEGNKILSNGGRVLGVTAVAENISKARELSYQAIANIDFPNGFYRRDIGAKVINY